VGNCNVRSVTTPLPILITVSEISSFYTLVRGSDLVCATEGLGSPKHLPQDGTIWDQKVSISPLNSI